ncbi:MAG: hypothetical protein KGD59_10645 [Candidatus Heimdallarchaeota archaeon]|nr:hypothetical protein [Candidatus Heimdallarchaeota archaeon]MBY8994997.1 hypothetical protein [Candidatus Heimdallarchaeota archaeon]
MKAIIDIPKLKKVQFEEWAKKILDQYEIKDNETLENITQYVAEFFDKLFKNYQVSFVDLHPDGIFPFAINRLDKKPGYADEEFYDELFKVENHIRWTYTQVLTLLYREKECPFDTAECPY